MSYMLIEPATVTVHSLEDLVSAWEMYGPSATVGAFAITAPLKSSQLRRLPASLRKRLAVQVVGKTACPQG